MSAIPVLDLRDYIAGGVSAERFVDELRDVVHEIGFFHLVGHGVEPELLREAPAVAARFFDLPDAARFEIDNVKSPQFRGYTRFGHEQTNGKVDLRDQIDIGREQPARELGDDELGPDQKAWLRLRGPNLWPSALPELRPVMTSLMDRLESVGATLLGAMSEALGQPTDAFAAAVSPPEVLLKVIRYMTPPDPRAADDEPANRHGEGSASDEPHAARGGSAADDEPANRRGEGSASDEPHAARGGSAADDEPANRQGVGSHRDTGFLTFVHQHEVGGLQVDQDGSFVDVPVLADALVVNVGEMFQLVTRGYFKATVHRVVSPPPGITRISLAYFFNPKLEATLTPIELPPELAAEAPGGESVDPANPILANYGDNSLKVRLRAHPDVAAAHHGDLLASGRWSM